MKIRKTIKVAVQQLLIHRLKSFWAIIGLSIGVTSVITMVAVGNGAKAGAISQLEKMGTNLITINAGKVKKVMERRQNTDLVSSLRMNDCEAILRGCPSVKEVVPSVSGMIKVKHGNTAATYMINGVSTPYFTIKNFLIDKGEVFSSFDNEQCKKVAVLGGQVSKNLFGAENPVGKILWVRQIPFTITGVLKSKGMSADGANLDAQVFVPVRTALRRIFNVDYLNRIFVEVETRQNMGKAESEMISVLRHTHKLGIRGKENDFTIDSQLTDLQTIDSSSKSFTWLIAGVAAIALFIGSIGVMAVMLLSVRERNLEIGLRISLGAKRKDITAQFLAESAILGLVGGLTGFVISLLLSLISILFTHWHIAIEPASVVISILFSMIIGLLSGVIPAFKASKADPISALQKE